MTFTQQATLLGPLVQWVNTSNTELDICLFRHYKSALNDMLFL